MTTKYWKVNTVLLRLDVWNWLDIRYMYSGL